MPVVLNRADLQTLELDINQLEAMTPEQQEKEIKKAWKRLVLTKHPDKGGSGAVFLEIQQAYNALTTGQATQCATDDMQAYDIDNYFTKSVFNVPDDAFDMLMQEGVAEVFANLRGEFHKLRDEKAKRQFAAYYASFLTLAEELENRGAELTRIRANALFYQQQEETLGEFMMREWKVLVIRLFAEEYLDDFQYRDVLANGSLGSILATRKLASPIKWLALITASLDLVFRVTGDYVTRGQAADFSFLIYFMGSPISVINFFVELLATPVNTLIRPLANSTGVSPGVYTALLSGVGAGIIYGFMSGLLTLSFATIQLALPMVTVALNLYSIYVTYQTVKNLQEMGEADAAIQIALAFGIVILVNLIPTDLAVVDFLFTVGSLCFFNAIKNLTEEKPIEFLPLPTQPISAELKEATLLGYTKANQSHRFFGTPKDANFDNQRTFWQKTSSFFGVDYTKPKGPDPQFGAHGQLLGLTL